MSTNSHNALDAPPDLSTWSGPQTRRAGGPLTAQQLRKLNQAGVQQKRLRRAEKIASFNGASLAVFTAVALIGGVFSTLSLVMGLVMGALTWNEFRGRKLLRDMDLLAPRVLGWNQLAFMGLLIGYALWKIYFGLTGPSVYAAEIAAYPQLDTTFNLTSLEKAITVSVYATLIAAAIIFQGGCAWYYFSRAKYLNAYVTTTDPWIMDIQRASGGA